jgi:hypothetical protein
MSSFPRGALAISLDFELHWGVRDSRPLDQYRQNLLGARAAIPAMLDLFRRTGTHATWATVGLLFCRSREEMLAASPRVRPRYRDVRLYPYGAIAGIGPDEAADPLHYGASLIEAIRGTPGQEIATHTFSHYYCLAPGQDLEAFEADLEAAIAIAARYGCATESIVFPRNQVNPAYFASCARLGIRAYRGNPPARIHRPDASAVERALRLADSYVALSGPGPRAAAARDCPVNVPASRFLRPYSRKLAALEPLRLRRICSEMSEAAREGRIYHLWWHPHNFGADLRENLSFLDAVLRHRGPLAMESLTMAGCAARLARAREGAGAVAV